jgi:anti-anti-sigma factor
LVVHVDGAAGRVTVSGRLDGGTVPALHQAVSTLLRAGRTRWRIDVAELVVVDDAGLRAIVGAYRRALRHGCRLTLHEVPPPLLDALIRLRLARHLLPGDDELRAGDATGPMIAVPSLHGPRGRGERR